MMTKLSSVNWLRKSDNFQRVTSDGVKIYSENFVIFILKTNGPTRFGITVSKKVGGAVFRNRVKRLLRHFFRTNFIHLPYDCDIVVIAKRSVSSVLNLNYSRIANELSKKLVKNDL